MAQGPASGEKSPSPVRVRPILLKGQKGVALNLYIYIKLIKVLSQYTFELYIEFTYYIIWYLSIIYLCLTRENEKCSYGHGYTKPKVNPQLFEILTLFNRGETEQLISLFSLFISLASLANYPVSKLTTLNSSSQSLHSHLAEILEKTGTNSVTPCAEKHTTTWTCRSPDGMMLCCQLSSGGYPSGQGSSSQIFLPLWVWILEDQKLHWSCITGKSVSMELVFYSPSPGCLLLHKPGFYELIFLRV